MAGRQRQTINYAKLNGFILQQGRKQQSGNENEDRLEKEEMEEEIMDCLTVESLKN